MKKKTLQRMILGFPIGVCVGYTVVLCISIFTKRYVPVAPQLIQLVGGSTFRAICLQYALTGICGMGCALATTFWNNDQWSLLKQTSLFFLVVALSVLPVAYICFWIPHSLLGLAIYVGLFLLIYVVSWFTIKGIWGRRVRRINEKI